MDEVKIQCPFCWEKFYIMVAVEDGESQQLIIDCEVCCHPINIDVYHNGKRWKALVDKSEGF